MQMVTIKVNQLSKFWKSIDGAIGIRTWDLKG